MTASFQITTRYDSCIYAKQLLDQAADHDQDTGDQLPLQLLLEMTAVEMGQQLLDHTAAGPRSLLPDMTAVYLVNSSWIRQLMTMAKTQEIQQLPLQLLLEMTAVERVNNSFLFSY